MNHLLLLLPLLTGQTAADAPVHEAVPAKPESPRVFLTVNSNRKDLLLFDRAKNEAVCSMPCNMLLSAGPDDVYYLGGSGIAPSSRFTLTEASKGAKIDIRAGSRPAKIVGIIFTAVSIPTLLGGAGQMVWYGIQQIPQVRDGMNNNGWGAFYNPVSTLVTAIIELAVGAALLTTGIILWSRNRTRMSLTPMDPPAVLPEPSLPPPPEQPAEKAADTPAAEKPAPDKPAAEEKPAAPPPGKAAPGATQT